MFYIEEAYAGDIIGVFDPGIFSIGDTICTPGKKITNHQVQNHQVMLLPQQPLFAHYLLQKID